jgi:hypothetical protein
MKNGIIRSVVENQYHWVAYHLCAYAAGVCSGVYVVHQIDGIADVQRRLTMKAHTHRVKAQKAIE